MPVLLKGLLDYKVNLNCIDLILKDSAADPKLLIINIYYSDLGPTECNQLSHSIKDLKTDKGLKINLTLSYNVFKFIEIKALKRQAELLIIIYTAK